MILDQIWEQKTTRTDQIDHTNSGDTKIASYDPLTAIEAYANMVKLDTQIRDLNPKISDLTTAKAMGIFDVSLSLCELLSNQTAWSYRNNKLLFYLMRLNHILIQKTPYIVGGNH